MKSDDMARTTHQSYHKMGITKKCKNKEARLKVTKHVLNLSYNTVFSYVLPIDV